VTVYLVKKVMVYSIAKKANVLYTPEPVTESMDETVAIYARVSTADQDAQRQLDELEAFASDEYPDADILPCHDIVSGTDTGSGDGYQRLRDHIAEDDVDAVIVDEISRLSRLGGGEIHDFIQFCLEHDTSVRDREVGLSIDVDDSAVDQAVSEMLIALMGDLARIEHTQKLRRIRSGIAAAQDAGTWTGRPPLGFEVDDGRLRVDVEEFLRVRGAIERVAAGESRASVAEDTGIASSTLKNSYTERADLYLFGDADDERIEAAVDEITPLPEPVAIPVTSEERVREIVRDELESADE
jgi:DNA invertase Pin-like site-specific DNA recombinase